MTQEELRKALEALGNSGITVNGDLVLSKHVENEIGNVEAGGIGIQNVYTGKGTKPAKTTRKNTSGKAGDKPKTLKYFTHGNKGILMKQQRRVNILFQLWSKWGWIDENTPADDFNKFFEGEPRHCNLTWTGNTTILTILLQELLLQTYIEKQTGCSAKSLVEKQFGKTANSDRNRLDTTSKENIRITLYVLDIDKPLPLRQGGGDHDYDVSDTAFRMVLSGELHASKKF